MNIVETNLQWRGEMNDNNKTNLIILHHAEASNCTIQDIHQWHLNNGWAGCGYHFFVRKDGSVYRGRPEYVIGVHCMGFNTNSIGICAEGAYMTETMPEVQKQAIIELCQYLINKYPAINRVLGHKELNATDCPGTNYPLVEIKEKALVKANTTVNNSNQGNPVIKSFQHACNLSGITDENGNKLAEDGLAGVGGHTRYVVANKVWIHFGMTGELIKWLQNTLINLGFSCGSCGVDGSFGFATLSAVQHYQAKNNLVADGSVGKLTLSKLLGF